jgi:hypothetical protein
VFENYICTKLFCCVAGCVAVCIHSHYQFVLSQRCVDRSLRSAFPLFWGLFGLLAGS